MKPVTVAALNTGPTGMSIDRPSVTENPNPATMSAALVEAVRLMEKGELNDDPPGPDSWYVPGVPYVTLLDPYFVPERLRPLFEVTGADHKAAAMRASVMHAPALPQWREGQPLFAPASWPAGYVRWRLAIRTDEYLVFEAALTRTHGLRSKAEAELNRIRKAIAPHTCTSCGKVAASEVRTIATDDGPEGWACRPLCEGCRRAAYRAWFEDATRFTCTTCGKVAPAEVRTLEVDYGPEGWDQRPLCTACRATEHRAWLHETPGLPAGESDEAGRPWQERLAALQAMLEPTQPQQEPEPDNTQAPAVKAGVLRRRRAPRSGS